MSQTNSPITSAEQERQWVQNEYARALNYLARHGVTSQRVRQPESRILPPLVALWRFDVLDGKQESALWVVGGDALVQDHAPLSIGSDPREALRHFYMSWQLKAVRLENELAAGTLGAQAAAGQRQYIAVLQQAATRLHDLVNEPRLWGSVPA